MICIIFYVSTSTIQTFYCWAIYFVLLENAHVRCRQCSPVMLALADQTICFVELASIKWPQDRKSVV